MLVSDWVCGYISCSWIGDNYNFSDKVSINELALLLGEDKTIYHWVNRKKIYLLIKQEVFRVFIILKTKIYSIKTCLFPLNEENIHLIVGTKSKIFLTRQLLFEFQHVLCTWACHVKTTLIKKETKFSSYLRKSRRERLQSHTWPTASKYMTKYLRISSNIRNHSHFLIYEENLFSFYQCSKQVYLLIVQRNNNRKTACVYITWSQLVTGVKYS